jgi:hypothetical protein
VCLIEAGSGVIRQRGEGVSIVPQSPAVKAWKAGGNKWEAWSSRLVTATVTMEMGSGSANRLHVLSCYAPTFTASREEKDCFFASLLD